MIKCICKICNKQFSRKPSAIKGKNGVCCSRKCFYESIKNFNHPAWKNGRRSHGKSGYMQILTPDHPRAVNNYVYEHILIAEKALKRYLKKRECIHHINENTSDNHLKNLYLFKNNWEHLFYHRQVKKGRCERIIKSNLI